MSNHDNKKQAKQQIARPSSHQGTFKRSQRSWKPWSPSWQNNVLQQRRRLNHWCQAKFLTCKISDFTPYAHAQSSVQRINYAEKTDD